MLKRAILLLVAAASLGIAGPAAAQCHPFQTGASCARPGKPPFNVDFGVKAFKAAQPAQPRTPPVEAQSRIRLTHRPQAIDCLMVKRADGSIDPGLVTPPPPGHHTLRILAVPSCSDDK